MKQTSSNRIKWPFPTAILVSLVASGIFDVVLNANQYTDLTEARVTTLYVGVVTVLALAISVGALVYVEFLKFAGNLYSSFVAALSNITTNPEMSSWTPPKIKEEADKAGISLGGDDFWTQPSWNQIGTTTQSRTKETTRVIDSLFFGLVGISGFGIVLTLAFSLVQTFQYEVFLSLDFGISGVIFFGILLTLFGTLRKSSLELLPIMVVSSRAVSSKEESKDK